MNARNFITVLLVIFIVSTFSFIPSATFADEPNSNYPVPASVLNSGNSGNWTFAEIWNAGVKYIFIFDGVQLIYSYPED